MIEVIFKSLADDRGVFFSDSKVKQSVCKRQGQISLQELRKVVQRTRLLQRHNRQATAHPWKEVDQLLSTVTNTVQASSATGNRKTTETLCSLTTLDDLHRELTNLGFKLSHSAVYLRVLPRRGDSREGKRHIQMAPVKLLRSEHSLRPKNIDSMYVKREILLWWHDVNQWATWRRCCNLPVKRCKARIAMGFAAASLQSPILMHLDYQVRLPDHDFVIGQKHKLISFVYGVCEVSTKGKVSIQVIHSSK